MIDTASCDVILIDRHESSRQFFAQTLAQAGYRFCVANNYDLQELPLATSQALPPLIVLCCLDVGAAEQVLLSNLILLQQKVIVLCASVTMSVARTLFRAGVDVDQKVYDPDRVIQIMHNAQAEMK